VVTAQKLLGRLPEYRDEWVMITPRQKVKDIIRQILAAHDKYAGYYDKIALYFDDKTVRGICNKLYNFCTREIKYSEETEEDQTTSLPSGILTRGHGDCKHYANFCGGVLDALTRLTGKKIDWCYRFASYHALSDTPHHVFIVVNDNAEEIWLDPVPGSNGLTPFWQVDKKINAPFMPLYDNIGSVPGGGRRVGLIDDVISVAEIGTGVWDKITTLLNGDKVPNYPVKSTTTFNSLVASVNASIPVPTSVSDAKRILAIALDERAKAVARGTDRATLTAIMLIDERITAIQNYIASGGKTWSMPAPGSGSSSPVGPSTTPGAGGSLTAGSFSGPVMLALIGAGAYMLFSKKRAVSGTPGLLPLALGAGVLYLVVKGSGGSIAEKKSALMAYIDSSGDSLTTKAQMKSIVTQMTDKEVSDTSNFIFNYAGSGKTVPPALATSINNIGAKYNIFT